MATQISEDDYLEASENYLGFCTTCCKFTREDTEPDAEGYNCPSCENDTVIGAEDALMNDYIEVG